MAVTMTLAARTGAAFQVPRGGTLRVINTYGSQVVDTWAVARQEPQHGLSMAHTRAVLGRLVVKAGDELVDDRRRPVLHIAEDTSPGVHDTLIPACDPVRYRQLGHTGHHDNCSDNYHRALADSGLPDLLIPVPVPLNLFMNVPVNSDGDIVFSAPVSRPGDSVLLRALADVVVVLSAGHPPGQRRSPAAEGRGGPDHGRPGQAHRRAVMNRETGSDAAATRRRTAGPPPHPWRDRS
ncbi:urea carboxylase-associated family protein [Streptomyces sp. NPDC048665]|uniref:urea carboxylase-associated family protein n=1 Tax=Streptomyces sp. NPDC048665 TaxID=3155490 RepID=UPI00341F33BF